MNQSIWRSHKDSIDRISIRSNDKLLMMSIVKFGNTMKRDSFITTCNGYLVLQICEVIARVRDDMSSDDKK